jgi:hypothetical protein
LVFAALGFVAFVDVDCFAIVHTANVGGPSVEGGSLVIGLTDPSCPDAAGLATDQV